MFGKVEGVDLERDRIADPDEANVARGHIDVGDHRLVHRHGGYQLVARLKNGADRQFGDREDDRIIGRDDPHHVLVHQGLLERGGRGVAIVLRRHEVLAVGGAPLLDESVAIGLVGADLRLRFVQRIGQVLDLTLHFDIAVLRRQFVQQRPRARSQKLRPHALDFFGDGGPLVEARDVVPGLGDGRLGLLDLVVEALDLGPVLRVAIDEQLFLQLIVMALVGIVVARENRAFPVSSAWSRAICALRLATCCRSWVTSAVAKVEFRVAITSPFLTSMPSRTLMLLMIDWSSA